MAETITASLTVRGETITAEFNTLPRGVTGDSAYAIAVSNGFEGTEEEWLASLQGSDASVNAANTSAAVVAMNATQVRASKGALGVPFVNAKTDFGALGDNATNDTVAIQAAIDYLGDLGGGTVYLPAGTFRLGRTVQDINDEDKHCLNLRSGVTLLGEGPGVTILKPLENVSGNTQVLLAYPVGAETRVTYVSVRNLTIDGNITRPGVSALGEDEGINIKLTLHAVFENLIIKNCGQDAIDHDGATGEGMIFVRNCYFLDNYGSGLHTREAVLNVDSCYFENNAHQKALDGNPDVAAFAVALDCESTPVVNVSNCYFKNNNIDLTLGNANVTNCYFENGGSRISVRADFAGRMTGCRWNITSITGKAIDCQGEANSRLFLGNCTIVSLGHGVYSSSGGEIIITGGSINVNQHAMRITAQNGKRVTVTGVTIDGYCYVNGAGGGSFVGNTFLKSSGTQLEITNGANNWQIKDNNFAVASTHSLRLAEWDGGTATTGCLVMGNHFAGPVQIRSGSNVFRGNKFASTVDLSVGTGNTYENNEFVGAISGTDRYNNNTWRRNFGAGVSGVFSGTTAAMTTGTVTVSTAAAYSGSKIRLERRALGSSTGVGHLTYGTITAGTSFVITSKTAANATETGDLSTVDWEIEN